MSANDTLNLDDIWPPFLIPIIFLQVKLLKLEKSYQGKTRGLSGWLKSTKIYIRSNFLHTALWVNFIVGLRNWIVAIKLYVTTLKAAMLAWMHIIINVACQLHITQAPSSGIWKKIFDVLLKATFTNVHRGHGLKVHKQLSLVSLWWFKYYCKVFLMWVHITDLGVIFFFW